MPTASTPGTITLRGACPHDCPDTCATLVDVRDGQAVGFRGDPDHPVTQGWLCAKVRPYLQRVYAPDRLQYPMRRVGPKGADQWQRVSWEEALAEIAERWQQIITEDGAAAILPYSFSGTLGLLQGTVAATRLWGRLGVTGLEGDLCGAAAMTAVTATLGAGWAPDVRDLAHAKMIIIWGHNPASTSPHSVPFLREAQRAGAYVVVIDPRRTTTARSADEHVRPHPATDGALALGLMHVIFREGLHDEDWLRQHTLGWEALRERALAYPPERVAGITGVPVERIEALAVRYATTKPAMLKFTDGIQRHGNGGQTCRALSCLPATTQLEQTDLHKPYGHRHLQYNHAAIAPLAEAKSNWEVSQLLASALGHDEPWLQQTPEDALEEIIEASRAANPTLAGITLRRLQEEGTVPYALGEGHVPFADGVFPTPSGKVELCCAAMADAGLDPLPEYRPPAEFAAGLGLDDAGQPAVVLLSGASHHFVSTSMANQPSLVAKEGTPFIEINPEDAAARGIEHGEDVIVSNRRGWCTLRAVVTEDVLPGVAVAPKGRWAALSPDGRNVNRLTSDAIADLAGQSTYHSNLVHLRPAAPAPRLAAETELLATVAD